MGVELKKHRAERFTSLFLSQPRCEEGKELLHLAHACLALLVAAHGRDDDGRVAAVV